MLRAFAAAFVLVLVTGCSNPVADLFARRNAPEVYVAEGRVVELRSPAVLKVWTKDAKTGQWVRGYVNAYPGSLWGPAAPTRTPDGKEIPPPQLPEPLPKNSEVK